MWRWIRAFLSDRRMRVVHRGRCSQWHSINAGVPQGSVLAPILFLVFIDDLPRCTAANLIFYLYADDIALHPNPSLEWSLAINAIRNGLRDLTRFARDNRILFNINKCAILRFSRDGWVVGRKRRLRQRRETKEPAFELCGSPLPKKEEYPYLGIVLQNDLSWNSHGHRVLDRVRLASQRIQRLCHRGDAPPRLPVIRQLVNAVVTPVISYGAHVWNPFQHCRPRLQRQLQSAMARPLIRCLRLPYSVSHSSLFVECGMFDLRAVIDRSSLAFVSRIASVPEHPSRHSIGTQMA
jgi:hypothetical protein